MRLRIAALVASILAVLMLSGWWIITQRRNVTAREHAAALSRASREPGVLIPDPTLEPGVIMVELIPAGPSIELLEPAMIRIGQQTRQWSRGRRVRFVDMGGARNLRVSVLGDYLAEGAWLDWPRGGGGARVALRAIPIDPTMPSPPYERQLEISNKDPRDLIVWWKQSNIVVSETKVPRAAGRDAIAAHLQNEWTTQGYHRDPSDRRFDRAIVRFEPETHFHDVFPLVDAILATKRTINQAGEARSVPAFQVSLQPAPQVPPARPDLDDGRSRAAPF
jgi:hypothetical protein